MYLGDGNVYRLVLKNNTATMFFLKKPVVVTSFVIVSGNGQCSVCSFMQ